VNAKTTIRKILFVSLWLCIGGGMLTLLLAAITKKKRGECSDYSISIKGATKNLFIDEKDVEQLLMKATKSKIKGLAVSSFNLSALEKSLEKNTWINDAELYFDNQDVLHVTVTEKEPVARIFTVTGISFYLDSAGAKMPLSDKISARVPVFTGFPDKKVLNAKDSMLLQEVRTTANFIISDPFWMAQVAQLDIAEDGTFEMTPVVGNHTVKLGSGENIDKKFHRLMVFYKQVLSKTGFDKYKMIDVQYKGQVVVSKQAGDVKIDSVQLRKNVEKLLKQAIEAENDTAIKAMPALGRYMLDIDSATNEAFNTPDDNSDKKLTNPNAVKTTSNPTPKPVITKPVTTKPATVKKDTDKKTEKPKTTIKPAAKDNKPKPKEKTTGKKKDPKAVMPKKPAVESEYGGYN
jgi:cell division protein FtsQ